MAVHASLPFFFNNSTGDALQWPDDGSAFPLPSSQQQLMQQHFVPSIPPPPNAGCSSLAPLSTDFSQSLASLMEKQRQDIDQCLRLQNERLRADLAQRTNQHAGSLLMMLESKASVLLRHKDEELAKAHKRAVELSELIRKAEEEKVSWQRAAQDNEAMAMALGNALRQVQQSCATGAAAGEEDEASYTDSPRLEGDGGGGAIPTGEIDSWWHPCKSCAYRDSCVMLIPCRHLCLCQACAALLDACPLCGSLKRDSLEVLLA